MDFLQNVDTTVVLIALACLCVVGFVLLNLLQAVGTVFGAVSGIFDIAFALLGGDPITGCGCMSTLVICAVVACIGIFAASVLSTCGTPQAVMFCSWLGR